MVESDALLFVMIENSKALWRDGTLICAPGFDSGRDAERANLPRRRVWVFSDSSAKQKRQIGNNFCEHEREKTTRQRQTFKRREHCADLRDTAYGVQLCGSPHCGRAHSCHYFSPVEMKKRPCCCTTHEKKHRHSAGFAAAIKEKRRARSKKRNVTILGLHRILLVASDSYGNDRFARIELNLQ